jgi:hypothetical protein
MTHPAIQLGWLVGGALLGAAVGLLGPFNYCYLLSSMEDSNNVMAVGWVFCFFTLPVGALVGGALGIRASHPITAPWDIGPDETRAIAGKRLPLEARWPIDANQPRPGTTSRLAIIALISSALGLAILLAGGLILDGFGFGTARRHAAMLLLVISHLGFLAALGLGYAARRSIRGSGGELAGDRLATLAAAMGLLGMSPVVVTGGLLLVFMAISLLIA